MHITHHFATKNWVSSNNEPGSVLLLKKKRSIFFSNLIKLIQCLKSHLMSNS